MSPLFCVLVFLSSHAEFVAREEITGTRVDAANAFRHLDSNPATEQTTDDSLTTGRQKRAQGKLEPGCLLQQAQNATAEQSANRRGCDDEPTLVVFESAAVSVAASPINGIPSV
jgi:hypothetical protein